MHDCLSPFFVGDLASILKVLAPDTAVKLISSGIVGVTSKETGMRAVNVNRLHGETILEGVFTLLAIHQLTSVVWILCHVYIFFYS